MKQVIVNETKLSGYTLYSTAPVGAVFSFAGEVVPPGYLECNGQSLSKTSYSKLYAVIGDTYGSTETTFNIPDLRRRFIEGADGNTGEHKEAGLPNITGEMSKMNFNAVRTGAFSINTVSGTVGLVNTGTESSSRFSFNAKNGETKIDGTIKTESEHHVYGSSDTVQPDSLCLIYIIKATEYASLEANAIDDSKATTGNTWSADKLNKRSTYSTEEQVVGTFLNKPLYRKTWDTTTSQTPTQTVVVSNVDKLVNQYGFYTLSGNRQLPFGIAGGSTYGYAENNSTTHELKVVTDGSGAWCFTLEYTKTTD